MEINQINNCSTWDVAVTAMKTSVGKELNLCNISEHDIEVFKRSVNGGHLGLLEHIPYTFYISGISRTCSHQLVRHRMASYVQKSQRYTKLDGEDYYVEPESIKKDLDTHELFINTCHLALDAYNKLINAGIKKEDARFILPECTKTDITMTVNARSLVESSRQRLCGRAQWEIREVYTRLKEILNNGNSCDQFIASLMIPKCEYLGKCTEEHSCGYWSNKDVHE